MRNIKPGTRVSVFSGDQERSLGDGIYQGDVTVYIWANPDGSISSMTYAEKPPGKENIYPGSRISKIDKNPKILLDSGQVVYGCQVWWTPKQ